MNAARNFDNDPDVWGIVGCQGTGKSTAQREIVRRYIREGAHVAIYDHKHQFQSHLPCKFVARNRIEFLAAWQQTRFVCFDPYKLYGENLEQGLSDFCELFWIEQKKLGGNVRKLGVIDEGDYLPDNKNDWFRHPLRKSTNTGREWGVDVCLTAQAPTDFFLKLRNQINHWLVFKLGDEGCMAPLLKHGLTWEQVRDLPKGHYWHLNKKTGAITREQTDRNA